MAVYPDAVWYPSPNFDERPDHVDISAIVLHSISLPPGKYHTRSLEQHPVLRFFTNVLDCGEHPYYQKLKGVRVSAHFFIRRAGECIQLVDTNSRAWHAGESYCQERAGANDFSIGIELEGWDESDHGYTDFQYSELTKLVNYLLQQHVGITRSSIYAHSDIAPGRKIDPGPHFDWSRVFSAL